MLVEELNCRSPMTNKKDQLNRNEYPEHIPLGEYHLYSLYHLVDKVYLKPRTVLNILFRIAMPASEHDKKPRSWLKSPKDFAIFEVMIGCIN